VGQKTISYVAGPNETLVSVTGLALPEVHAGTFLAREVPLENRFAVSREGEAALHKHVLLCFWPIKEKSDGAVAKIFIIVCIGEKFDSPQTTKGLKLRAAMHRARLDVEDFPRYEHTFWLRFPGKHGFWGSALMI
jgi:hypothetical protein